MHQSTVCGAESDHGPPNSVRRWVSEHAAKKTAHLGTFRKAKIKQSAPYVTFRLYP